MVARRAPFVTGLVLAILITGVLVASPASFVGRGATFIDTTSWASRGGGVPVETAAYLRSTEDLLDFPASFESWNMTSDVAASWQNVADFYDADAMISRYYAQRGLYVPIHLFIIDSKFTRVLHSLPVSYGLQGLEAVSQEDRLLDMSEAHWIDEDSPNQEVPVVEMEFVRKNATSGEVLERRLVHYFWVKREAWGVTNHMTWVGANMLVPTTGDLSPHRALLGNFTTDVIAQIFVPDASDVAPTVAHALLDDRPTGPVLLGASVLVPLALIGYGLAGVRRRDEPDL